MFDFHILEMIVRAVQLAGIAIPLIGIFVLIDKEQSEAALYLMVADIGCLIMNAAYFLQLESKGHGEALLALKIEYVGNAVFYLFFVLFIISFLKLKIPKCFTYIWLGLEILAVISIWTERLRGIMFQNTDLKEDIMAGIHYLDIESNTMYDIRNGLVSFILLALIIVMLVRIYKNDGESDVQRLRHMIFVQLIVLSPIVLRILLRNLSFDAVPICSSIAVFAVMFGVLDSDFFRATNIARGFVFEQMDDVFIIVDKNYGYLDANSYAKEHFKELKSLPKRERIPESLYQVFVSDKIDFALDGRRYEKLITDIGMRNKTVGYCLMLMDVTGKYELMDELVEAKERAEDANMTKSNFISNMSHEIRTPMNAIVGMTEILLRTELDDTQKGYLYNIKNSGAALLTIINDILDFSKIESGKLEIIEDDYEPMSLLSDLGMIFLNRIGDKPIELMFDIDRELPLKLYGDALRLRQVIINIANNAIKFTQEGYVTLTIRAENKGAGAGEALEAEDMIWLSVSVKDTGQGIRQEDMDKLFASFSQVDTRKNRNKEGTGLGLSISKQLVELMGGEIGVRSEYGVGSEFYFTIPQRVVNGKRAADIRYNAAERRDIYVSGKMSDERLLSNLRELAEGYGLTYIPAQEIQAQEHEISFFFTDDALYPELEPYIDGIREKSAQICILQNPMRDNHCIKDVTVVNRPLFSLNFCQVINHDSLSIYADMDEAANFTAPEAQLLIVDDNEMNLKVALGLLQPLMMKLDTADSGKKALEMLKKKHYDIVFMDHMMPVMDGVETTGRIRSMEKDEFNDYARLPIIALTANAVVGARESFKKAGMNDFVAKPIEVKEICKKIREWLPDTLIQKRTQPQQTPGDMASANSKELGPEGMGEELNENLNEELKIEGLNTEEGIKNCGSRSLFMELLGDFYKLIDMKSTKLEKCLADGMIRDYTIEVHALKNTARMIGAMELSEWFYKMEQCGNAEDTDTINRENPELMKLYRSYKETLAPFAGIGDEGKEQADIGEIAELLRQMKEAVDSFDLDKVDENMARLEKIRLPNEITGDMEKLRAYVADVAMEDIMQIADVMAEKCTSLS